MIKRALLSVWDKSGIVELAAFLHQNNVELLSTGGTRKTLEAVGLPVESVSGITGHGSVMDGRVKTLNPRIFGGILADRNNSSHLDDLTELGGMAIDLVVVNFYPFVAEAVDKNLDLRQAIEYIDIGGPSMIRAAAKNFHSVVPLCNPGQYSSFQEIFEQNNGDIPMESRQLFAGKVFEMTAGYEAAICNYISSSGGRLGNRLFLGLDHSAELRYGENPHQSAAFYLEQGQDLPWIQHQGKELSYNNYADIEAAYNIVRIFEEDSCSIIKHANPCGFGRGQILLNAWEKAVATDPVSYFGGIVGLNKTVGADLASALIKPFLECIIAPEYTPAALAVLQKKKNLRVVTIRPDYHPDSTRLRSVAGGFLIQEQDSEQGELDNLQIVTTRQPSQSELAAMGLGWKLVRFVKSNAIVFASHDQLLGVGAGQMSRVDSVKIAIRKAREAGLDLQGTAMASDAFFPFPDGVELAAEAGITAVIQPGGSMRDSDVIQRADELGLTMGITKVRRFYH